MGRKSKNIKIDLNRRIDELLRIGEKKIKDGLRGFIPSALPIHTEA